MTTINTMDTLALEKHLKSVSTISSLAEQLKVYAGEDLGYIVHLFLRRAYQLGLQNKGLEDQKEEEDSLGDLNERLKYLGLIPDGSDVRSHNEGNSNYNDGTHIITPWTIWLDYPELTSWDDDIIKRVLRTKADAGYTPEEQRILDYKKIIHNCQERIRQLKYHIK